VLRAHRSKALREDYYEHGFYRETRLLSGVKLEKEQIIRAVRPANRLGSRLAPRIRSLESKGMFDFWDLKERIAV
jgi:hypothetical protein